jgi:hypothetical protein
MNRQRDVLRWAIRTFGPIAGNRDERAARFLEEAIELAQAEGITRMVALNIAYRVFSRTPGHSDVEVGQAMMTLEALAENIGVDANDECRKEFDRVRTISQDEWDRRHAAKVALGIANLSPVRVSA